MSKSLKKSFDAVATGIPAGSAKDLRIVEYANADAPLRKQMDAVIATIEAAPGSAAAIAAYGADIIDAITTFYNKIESLSQKDLRERAGRLLPQSLELLHEANGYVGTYREVLRRYNEVYIPAAEKQAAATGLDKDEQHLQQIEQRKHDFLDRTYMLEVARALSVVTTKHLEASYDQKDKLDVIRNAEVLNHLISPKPAAKGPARKP